MLRDIDQILELLRREIPGVEITQLQVSHPGADDDGLWFVRVPGRKEEVQIESSSGNCPFLIESDFSTDRHYGRSVYEVVGTVWKLFAEPGTAPNGGPATPVGNSGAAGGPPSVS
jgi:hypothetical protein